MADARNGRNEITRLAREARQTLGREAYSIIQDRADELYRAGAIEEAFILRLVARELREPD